MGYRAGLNKQKVQARIPNAFAAYEYMRIPPWVVGTVRTGLLGEGNSAAAAWAHAWHNIKAKDNGAQVDTAVQRHEETSGQNTVAHRRAVRKICP